MLATPAAMRVIGHNIPDAGGFEAFTNPSLLFVIAAVLGAIAVAALGAVLNTHLAANLNADVNVNVALDPEARLRMPVEMLGSMVNVLDGGLTTVYYAMAGIYYVVPKLAGRRLFSEKLGDLQFWIMTLASIPFFAVLWISGVVQGYAWLNPENSFVETLEAIRHAHIMRFATGVLIFLAYFLFLYNVLQTFFGKYGDESETETAVAG